MIADIAGLAQVGGQFSELLQYVFSLLQYVFSVLLKYAKTLAALGTAVFGVLLVYFGAGQPRIGLGVGLWAAGLAATAGTALALDGPAAAAFFGALYLLAGSAGSVFLLQRRPGEVGLWGVLAAAGIVVLMATADAKTAAFAAAAVLIVFSSLKVLQTNVLVHATVWLAGMLVGVAGIYLSLGAEFLAAIQILVYVGAVITLFLFTVMLTIPEPESHLEGIQLPPGVTIESVENLEAATPLFGVGPYKKLTETNPRKPTRSPPTLYGVHIADGVFGDESFEERRKAKKQEKEA